MKNHSFITTDSCLMAFSLVLASCAKETAPRSTVSTPRFSKSTTEWLVFVPNRSHVVMFETVPNSGISYRVVVSGLGEASLPQDLDMPEAFSSVQLSGSPSEALCLKENSTPWLFKLDATTSTFSDIVIGVKGLSELSDEHGWDLGVVANLSPDNAWDLIYRGCAKPTARA